MKKQTFAALAMFALLATPLAGHARHAVTVQYVAATGVSQSRTVSGAPGVQGIGVGGFTFSTLATQGQKPKSIKINDTAGGSSIAVSVCQNTDTVSSNCSAGDPKVFKCLKSGAKPFTITKLAKWKSGVPIVVYIEASGDSAVFVGPSCNDVATTGTFTLALQ